MVLTFLLIGCTKQPPSVSFTSPKNLESIAIIDHIDERKAQPVPEELRNRIISELQDRKVVVEFRNDVEEAFSNQRLSEQRAKMIAARPLLLIETEATFYAQLNGRFRWTVSVRMNLWNENEDLYSRNFDVPVFQQFHHHQCKYLKFHEQLLAAHESLFA